MSVIRNLCFDRLPDYFCKPVVADGQLYFMEQGYDVQTVERTALPENGVTVKNDDTDVILCLSVSAIETEKDRGTGEELPERGVGAGGFPHFFGINWETAEKLMDFLEEADFTPGSRLRDMAVSIVLEESEAYYTGDKSLDEVVKLIQNRVSLVLAE